MESAVYDFNRMVAGLMSVDNMDEEEAMDWIYYNTVRALSYIGENAPIIIYPFE